MWNADQLSSGLLTDLYHVDSAYVSWRSGRNGLTTFDLYSRANPFGSGYMLAAGLELAVTFARSFHYSEEEIAYLKRVKPYEDAFYDELRRLRFTGEILGHAGGGDRLRARAAPAHDCPVPGSAAARGGSAARDLPLDLDRHQGRPDRACRRRARGLPSSGSGGRRSPTSPLAPGTWPDAEAPRSWPPPMRSRSRPVARSRMP